MKKLLSIVIAFALVFSLAACGNGQTSSPSNTSNSAPADSNQAQANNSEAKTEWKKMQLSFTTFQGESSMGNNNMFRLQDKLNEKMDGAIQLDYYFSGTLCSNADTLDGVISGVADIGIITIGNYPGRLPYLSLFDQCGIRWNSTEAASSSMYEFMNEWSDLGELEGVTPLLCTVTTPGFIASNKPIRTLEDFKGMSCRSTSTTNSAVEAMGANPTTLEWSECYEAMRNGMVDSLYTMPGACMTALIHEVAPYATVNPYYVASYMYVMNTDVLNSMPDEQRELFLQCCKEVQEEYTSSYAGRFEGEDRAPTYFSGIDELIFFSDEDLSEIDSRVSGLVDEYAASLDSQGYDGSGALEYLRGLAEKYNAEYPADDYNAYLLSWLEKSN